ncbi:MAG TPA: hypothetical protein PKD64_01415 [Pirellulaceae bacterium]|nr:hypothetical protein [Pirellulaceae bacterium]HMO90829.1 hypothetical protein [Pirellulaceae bacterium]HMP68080.1 hypothetical protein [Pirellulaceae bacterium]
MILMINKLPICLGRFILGLTVVIAVIQTSQPNLHAQKEFGPTHEVVQEMMEKAIRYLERVPASEFQDSVLFGLAAYKAMVWTAPTEADAKKHPLVVAGLNRVKKLFADGDMERESSFEANYAAAILIIFLLDIDAEGYQREVQYLLDLLLRNQQRSGAWGYVSSPDHGDTSQMQYVGLALWLADRSGYNIRPEVGKRALEWMIQTQGSSGGWIYNIPPMARSDPSGLVERPSLAASGAGTVYVLAEWLQLATRQSAQARQAREMAELAFELQLRLPPAVTEYNPDRPEEVLGNAKVAFDISKLRESMARSNAYFNSNFRPDPIDYTYYYLYAFERYASLREIVDGDVGRNFQDWYDQGVRYLRGVQNANGSFPQARGMHVTQARSTALAVLFLTRSMQQSLRRKLESTLVGNEGFGDGVLEERRGGGVFSQEVQRDVDEMLELLDGQSDDELRERLIKSIEETDFASGSLASQLGKLREYLNHRDADIRLVVVKKIGKVRDLDSVPGLIFALTDPDERVGVAAHDGLRFISRKVDSFALSPDPTLGELAEMKKRWIDWYFSVRPDGRLIDEPDG